MKKILLTVTVIVVFVLYSIYYNNSTVSVPVASNKNSGSDTASVAGTSTSQGGYKDGSYTGSAADAFYGTIQVKTIIQNGKIADVQFLQYPNDRDESVQVNQAAMPDLKQEAIKAQNAKVAVVTGATLTSQAFVQSLASALTQAK